MSGGVRPERRVHTNAVSDPSAPPPPEDNRTHNAACQGYWPAKPFKLKVSENTEKCLCSSQAGESTDAEVFAITGWMLRITDVLNVGQPKHIIRAHHSVGVNYMSFELQESLIAKKREFEINFRECIGSPVQLGDDSAIRDNKQNKNSNSDLFFCAQAS